MRVKHAAVVAGLALGLMSGTVKADTLEYNVLVPLFNGPGGAITGTIDTDYKAGNLSARDIVSYDLFFGSSEISSADPDSQLRLSGTSLIATGNELQFIFDGKGSYLSFVNTTNNDGSTVSFYAGDLLDSPFYQAADSLAFNSDNKVDVGTVLTIGVSEGTVSAVPLPASAPMFGAALMALGAVGYGLKRKGKAAA